jgi:hypothetical protein
MNEGLAVIRAQAALNRKANAIKNAKLNRQLDKEEPPSTLANLKAV